MCWYVRLDRLWTQNLDTVNIDANIDLFVCGVNRWYQVELLGQDANRKDILVIADYGFLVVSGQQA